MGEPYRTLLGHFRHEIAHYYWDRLIANSPSIDEFRKSDGIVIDLRGNPGGLAAMLMGISGHLRRIASASCAPVISGMA